MRCDLLWHNIEMAACIPISFALFPIEGLMMKAGGSKSYKSREVVAGPERIQILL